MAQLPTAPTTGRPCGKVPQLIQMEALECGATSLGMVCAYYGLWVSPEKLRADCGVSRDGAKALNIVKAARSYGFDSAGYRIEPALLQREGEFPCIIHWGFNHFVVLRGFKNGRALINDPARGEVEVSPEEFDEQFTGIVIKLAPNASFKPGGHKPSIWGFVRKRSLGTADGLLFVALATAIVGLLGLVPPLLAQTFTDKLIGSTDTALRVLFFAVLIALCVLSAGNIYFSYGDDLRGVLSESKTTAEEISSYAVENGYELLYGNIAYLTPNAAAYSDGKLIAGCWNDEIIFHAVPYLNTRDVYRRTDYSRALFVFHERELDAAYTEAAGSGAVLTERARFGEYVLCTSSQQLMYPTTDIIEYYVSMGMEPPR